MSEFPTSGWPFSASGSCSGCFVYRMHWPSPYWLALPLARLRRAGPGHEPIRRRSRRAGRAMEFYAKGLARMEDRWAGPGSTGWASWTSITPTPPTSTSSARARSSSGSARRGRAPARRRWPHGCWRPRRPETCHERHEAVDRAAAPARPPGGPGAAGGRRPLGHRSRGAGASGGKPRASFRASACGSPRFLLALARARPRWSAGRSSRPGSLPLIGVLALEGAFAPGWPAGSAACSRPRSTSAAHDLVLLADLLDRLEREPLRIGPAPQAPPVARDARAARLDADPPPGPALAPARHAEEPVLHAVRRRLALADAARHGRSTPGGGRGAGDRRVAPGGGRVRGPLRPGGLRRREPGRPVPRDRDRRGTVSRPRAWAIRSSPRTMRPQRRQSRRPVRALVVSGSNMSGKSTLLALGRRGGRDGPGRRPVRARRLAALSAGRRGDPAHPGLAPGRQVAVLCRDHPRPPASSTFARPAAAPVPVRRALPRHQLARPPHRAPSRCCAGCSSAARSA